MSRTAAPRPVIFSVAEWLTVVSTVIMAAVSVWQGWMFRQAAKDPFTSNLQSKQIDYCGAYLASASDLRSNFLLYGRVVRNDGLPAGIKLDEKRLRFDLRTVALNFGPQEQKLKMLASDAMKEVISSVSSARAAFMVIADAIEPTSKENDEAWLVQFDAGIAKVRARCTEVMVGNNVGML